MLSIRNLEPRDIVPITRYWLESPPAHHELMGVDIAKIPAAAQWEAILMEQIGQPIEQKGSYCFIWELDGEAVGHSNVNKIILGQEAFMHLHLWQPNCRQRGMGSALVRMTLPRFFEDLQLQKICCEPYALNPAPNRALEKVGFELVREYVTTPGWLNFEQPVKRWELSRERYFTLVSHGNPEGIVGAQYGCQ